MNTVVSSVGYQGLRNCNLVIMPEWLDSALKSSGESISAALDLKKLLTIASKEDVAFYCLLNSAEVTTCLLGKEVNDTFWFPVRDITHSVYKTISEEDDKTDTKFKQDCVALDSLYRSLGVEHGVFNYSADTVIDRKALLNGLLNCPADNTQSVAFDISLTADGLIVVRPAVCQSRSDETTAKIRTIDIYDELLDILCGTNDFAVVANTQLFKGYVKCLQH